LLFLTGVRFLSDSQVAMITLMATIQQSFHIEGTWEELVRHGDQFAGKRVRITVLPVEDQAELRRRATKLMAEADDCKPDANRPKLRDKPAEFADGVADKLRDQGIQS
jgi:hypothetical protein